MFDYVIIGGGIAGLYAAYKISHKKHVKILVLEKSPRKYLGGRMGVEIFKKTNIPIGAGIGRKNKDASLIRLLNELKIKFGEFPVTPVYAKTIQEKCELKKVFLKLKTNYDSEKDKHKTFKEYALEFLQPDEYKHFTTCSGYTDYENESAEGTLFHYGFDDNYAKWTGLSIGWRVLLDKLVDKIGKENIQCFQEVVSVEECGNYFELMTKTGKKCLAKKVILATTVDTVRALLPGLNIYKQIVGQPFIRVYGKFTKTSIPIMKEYLPVTMVVPGPIHKIIPMNPDNGVYMIAYSDNTDAMKLEKYSENNEKNRAFFCRLIEKSVGIPPNSLELTEIIDFYWQIGTHFYKPLYNKTRKEFIRIAQRPQPNMFVVGEMISTNQGWVEGALESVDSILDEL